VPIAPTNPRHPEIPLCNWRSKMPQSPHDIFYSVSSPNLTTIRRGKYKEAIKKEKKKRKRN
jgi:hypothetical protein